MTHEPRPKTSLREASVDARPLHDIVSDWAARRHLYLMPCVCGGPDIAAASQSSEDVMAAVQRHQVEPRHLEYDREQGIAWSEAQRRAAALDAIPAPMGSR